MIYQAQEPLKTIKLNDLVTIIVDEKTQVVSEADIQRRKQAQMNAQLKNWVELRNFSLKNAPQKDGTPHVNGTLQAQFRAQAELETRDGMKLRITTRVVDIRPNGHLVLEGHQTIRNNDEQWDRSISGIVRPEDILPNNTVLSEDVAELHIAKREQGQVRDGYRRGWFYRLLDRYGMF
jgi:flagellar L-ring protein precursor FlgH